MRSLNYGVPRDYFLWDRLHQYAGIKAQWHYWPEMLYALLRSIRAQSFFSPVRHATSCLLLFCATSAWLIDDAKRSQCHSHYWYLPFSFTHLFFWSHISASHPCSVLFWLHLNYRLTFLPWSGGHRWQWPWDTAVCLLHSGAAEQWQTKTLAQHKSAAYLDGVSGQHTHWYVGVF